MTGGTRTRRFPSLLLAGVAWLAIPAAAAAAQDPVDPEAKDVILRQLAAFRAGDYQAAYGFASRAIRDQFDLAAFEQMVKSGYPQIARSTHAWIAEARPGPDGALHILLRIRGADGTFILALYEMVREEPGWRINGVVARPDPGTL
ncbi:MAG TPA: DUF4864 domain-containing protein [Candidatus Methylomirabilis sp.]